MFLEVVGDEIILWTKEAFPGISQINVVMGLVAIPEPASVALMGIGLLGFGLAGRRKLSKKS